ncbi:MAG: MerR family transcriptional regulator [Candidatus Latescibacterota bacterium]
MSDILEKKYFAIGEVSTLTDVRPHILRYWEDAFALLKPKKNRAGNRAYRARDLKIVFLIKHLLREKHYTAETVQEKLREDPAYVKEQLDLPLSDWIAPPSLADRMKQDLAELLRMVEEW